MKVSNLIVILFFLIGSYSCTTKKEERSNSEMSLITEQLPDPLEAGWEGKSVCEVVEENDNIRVLKCVFPPGVGHEKHYHSPHVGYTLVGGLFRISNGSGTRQVDVKAGGSFSSESVTSHEVLNIGETTAEFLIIEYK